MGLGVASDGAYNHGRSFDNRDWTVNFLAEGWVASYVAYDIDEAHACLVSSQSEESRFLNVYLGPMIYSANGPRGPTSR